MLHFSSSLFKRFVSVINCHPKIKNQIKIILNFCGIEGFCRILKNKLLVAASENRLQLKYESYAVWSQDFDTPSARVLRKLDSTTPKQIQALVVVCFDDFTAKFASETAQRLINGVGLYWRAVFCYKGRDDGAQKSIEQSISLDTRILFNEIPQDSADNFLVVIQGGALPRSHALRSFYEALISAPNKFLAYCDEDILVDDHCAKPWFKPEFSPLLARQGMLFGKMIAVNLATEICEDFISRVIRESHSLSNVLLDLAMACPQGVLHVPHVLFNDAYPSTIQPLLLPNLSQNFPIVSIIIPTRDGWDILEPCLKSLLKTDWPADCLEIIIVDNGSTDCSTLKGLSQFESGQLVRIIRDDKPFNWSRLNNLAVRDSNGDFLVFLNNDTEMIDCSWLKILMQYLLLPDVGAVGCKLLYPDRTVQHGGVIAGVQGLAGHAHLFLPKDAGGYHNLSIISHEVSAVTGACLAVSRSNFDAVGGFDEQFKVAFNDTVFCFSLLKIGKRNVYVSNPLFYHHESKTRGYDDTPEKISLLRHEAAHAWFLHADILRNDPYYSPNLSLLDPYKLSFSPRRKPIWNEPQYPLRVMLLSETHAFGNGVPIVLALQAEALRSRGYEVFIGGPPSSREIQYFGCNRIVVHDSVEASHFARMQNIDVIIVYTPLFYGIASWCGAAIPVIAWDHGEPPSYFFPDAKERCGIIELKKFYLSMAYEVVAISDAIRDENPDIRYTVLRNGNSHLCQWSDSAYARRQACRKKYGWDNSYVVLNVCRFHSSERLYKGVDHYAVVRDAFNDRAPSGLKKRAVFVLSGRGSVEDVREMASLGLVVLANLSDDELADLYFAADAYANFSRWEGYNLGIGQALAAGLQVVASDIPAHREFGIPVTSDSNNAADLLIQFSSNSEKRKAKIWSWDVPLSGLCAMVERLSGDATFIIK